MGVAEYLDKSRLAFVGQIEREVLAYALGAWLPVGALRWLEVGVGNGLNLAFLLSKLQENRTFGVTAIDPDPRVPKDVLWEHSVTILPKAIEDCELTQTFHCINVRQSAYYFTDPQGTLLRLLRYLEPAGVLSLTLWSDECVLYKLHQAIAHYLGQTAAEPVHFDSILAGLPLDDFDFTWRRVAGALSLKVIEQSPDIAAALVGLAARTLNVDEIPSGVRAQLTLAVLRSLETPVRVNKLAFFRSRS